ncbi:MAG TPA: hemolysin family protein [Thermoanaerobaculia bacterium]|nr:hemolysin family protein [Thermoanaerobaculia bacterium]
MGSSLPHAHAHWVVIAIVCGILYLVFDALRSFVNQLSPVTLRRLSSDAEDRRPWSTFDFQNFQLASGALLQVALIIAAGCTVMIFDEHPIGTAVILSVAIWAGIVMVWKFILAIVPEDVAELTLTGLIPFSHFFYYLFWPLLYPLRRLTARDEEEDEEEEEEVTQEEVRAYIDVGEEEGILEGTEGKMIQSIVDFGDRLAHEIMTPRIDVQAFDAKRPLDELAKLFSESKYARIPIYLESIDQITGFVHIKDAFDAVLRHEQRPVSEIARPPYFVSETKKVTELLREFQSEHLQVAVVVDEYGGTAGIVTIEDIIEEIVGEIADEHEDEESTIVDLGDGIWLVSGLLRVETLEETLGAELAGENYETVAGLIFTTLGRVPPTGAIITKNGWRFEVDRADRRRIYRVRVSKDPDWTEEGEIEN